MTDPQLEQAARQYAKDTEPLAAYTAGKVLTAFLAGANFALSHQWVSVDVHLPEEKKAVLCYMPDMKDNCAEKDMYFDMAILLDGEFINLDAEIIHPTHWMPIPIPPLNPEKE